MSDTSSTWTAMDTMACEASPGRGQEEPIGPIWSGYTSLCTHCADNCGCTRTSETQVRRQAPGLALGASETLDGMHACQGLGAPVTCDERHACCRTSRGEKAGPAHCWAGQNEVHENPWEPLRMLTSHRLGSGLRLAESVKRGIGQCRAGYVGKGAFQSLTMCCPTSYYRSSQLNGSTWPTRTVKRASCQPYVT